MPNFRTLFALPFGISRYDSPADSPADQAIPITLAALMAIYWRVRDWELVASRTVTQQDGTSWPTESYTLTLANAASSETDLMDPHLTIAGSTSQTYTNSAGSSGTVTVSAYLGANGNNFGSGVYAVGNQIYFFAAAVTIGEHTTSAFTEVADQVGIQWTSLYSFDTSHSVMSSGTGQIQIPTMGTLPLYVVREAFNTISASILIRPKTWWSWGGTYDTTTGALF